jgi:hypothetical protein
MAFLRHWGHIIVLYAVVWMYLTIASPPGNSVGARARVPITPRGAALLGSSPRISGACWCGRRALRFGGGICLLLISAWVGVWGFLVLFVWCLMRSLLALNNYTGCLRSGWCVLAAWLAFFFVRQKRNNSIFPSALVSLSSLRSTSLFIRGKIFGLRSSAPTFTGHNVTWAFPSAVYLHPTASRANGHCWPLDANKRRMGRLRSCCDLWT